jgi:hypothetical protein
MQRLSPPHRYFATARGGCRFDCDFVRFLSAMQERIEKSRAITRSGPAIDMGGSAATGILDRFTQGFIPVRREARRRMIKF